MIKLQSPWGSLFIDPDQIVAIAEIKHSTGHLKSNIWVKGMSEPFNITQTCEEVIAAMLGKHKD